MSIARDTAIFGRSSREPEEQSTEGMPDEPDGLPALQASAVVRASGESAAAIRTWVSSRRSRVR